MLPKVSKIQSISNLPKYKQDTPASTKEENTNKVDFPGEKDSKPEAITFTYPTVNGLYEITPTEARSSRVVVTYEAIDKAIRMLSKVEEKILQLKV